MKSTKLLIKDLNEIMSTYQVNEYRVEKVNFGGEFVISFLLFNSMNELERNWQKLNGIFSEYLEEYMIDDFSRWNFYIIYLCKESVIKELQYKIENNTFFARKILEDKYILELTDENIEKLISEHIMFNDLKINSTQPQQQTYSSVSEIYQKLKDIDTMTQTQIDEMLKSLEGAESEI